MGRHREEKMSETERLIEEISLSKNNALKSNALERTINEYVAFCSACLNYLSLVLEGEKRNENKRNSKLKDDR